MSDTNIFKCKDAMPATSDENVVRTAMTSSESKNAMLPGERHNPEQAVRNVTRPRFGHGY